VATATLLATLTATPTPTVEPCISVGVLRQRVEVLEKAQKEALRNLFYIEGSIMTLEDAIRFALTPTPIAQGE
jgi:hypothetical protein